MTDKTLAVIDCGSHSTRLLAVEAAPDLKTLYRDMTVTRLGEDVKKTSQLQPAAQKRTLDCIRGYMDMLADIKPDETKVIATAAARKAENFEAFFDQIEELTLVRPILLEGRQEAELAFLGATHSLKDKAAKYEPPYLTIDIGGGSTEFGFGSSSCEHTISLPIGSVNLTEDYINSDPPLPEELYSCLSLVETYLSDIRQEIPSPESAKTFVGMAGTVTTAAAVELGLYDFHKVHHFLLTRPALEDVFRTLSIENREERLANPGLHPDRVDVIVAGLTILVKTMRFFDFQECLVSELDLMDGVIIDMLQRGELS